LLVPHAPANDIYRYVWEGWIQLQGLNPYAAAPAELAALAKDLPGVLERINHADLSAIYGPVAEFVFRGLAWLDPDPIVFKTAMLGFDIVTLGLLALVALRRSWPAKYLLLYAANPLVILFIAGEAHLDGLQNLLLAGGLAGFTFRRPGLGFVLLAAGGLIRYLPLAMLPFFVDGRSWRKAPWAALPLLAFLPYLDAGSGLVAVLAEFGTAMHYNDFLPAIARSVLGSWSAPVVGMALLVVLGVVWLTNHERITSALWGYGFVLLAVSTLHPWYLSALALLLVFAPNAAWPTLMACMAATFAVLGVEHATGVFQEIHWLKLLEYLPFLVILLVELRRGPLPGPRPTYPPARALSVVVPTRDEAANIADCLDSALGAPGVAEVIVCDAGSKDATTAIAAARGARVVDCPHGRGMQIAAGIRAARYDVVLVLHADCRLKPGSAARALACLDSRPGVPGGAFTMAFADPNWRNRLISFLNNLKTRLTGIAFGDQAQFFRIDALNAHGGFPECMLMEDVECAMRLKAAGRPAFLPHGVTASTRRWQKAGLPNVWIVLRLFTRYLASRRLGRVRGNLAEYHQIYYGS
jgi:rSAM/selenodomain-associated transferase 2